MLAALRERDGRREDRGENISPIPVSELLKTKAPTRRESYQAHIIERPIEGALRLAVRELGEHLWGKTKDTDKMERVLDKVCERNPGMSGRIGSYVDHAWDGTGDQWWA